MISMRDPLAPLPAKEIRESTRIPTLQDVRREAGGGSRTSRNREQAASCGDIGVNDGKRSRERV